MPSPPKSTCKMRDQSLNRVRMAKIQHREASRGAPEPSIENSAINHVLSKRTVQGRKLMSDGRDTLLDIEKRAVITRRYRDIFLSVVDDQGGAKHLSQTRLQLIRRFAASAVLAEGIEARLLRGERINVSEHIVLCGMLARMAQVIGIDRRMRDRAPTLSDYLQSPQAEKDEK